MLTSKTNGAERSDDGHLIERDVARDQAVVDLSPLAVPLWRARWVIGASAVVFGAVGLIVSLMSPATYEATVVMAAVPAVSDNPLRPTASTMLRPYLENRRAAAQVIAELGLDKAPYRMSPDTAFDRTFVVKDSRNASTLALSVRLQDRALAAKAANRMAELAIRLIRDVVSAQIAHVKQDTQVPIDQARTAFDAAQSRLQQFRDVSQIELVRRDIDSQLGMRGGLLNLLVSIEAEKAKLARSEADLALRSRIDTLTRTIDSDPALLESARTLGSQGKDLLSLRLRDQRINPVYEAIDANMAASRGILAGLEQQKAELVDGRKLDAEKLTALSQLYAKEAELARRQMDLEIARSVYVDLKTRYETALTKVTSINADLISIDPALPPSEAMPRQTIRSVAIAALVGLMLVPLLVLVFHAVAMMAASRAQADGR